MWKNSSIETFTKESRGSIIWFKKNNKKEREKNKKQHDRKIGCKRFQK